MERLDLWDYDALKPGSEAGTDPAKDFYYSNQGQVLEERESGASVAKRQYVWSAVYVDAMVLRDQDSGTGNSKGSHVECRIGDHRGRIANRLATRYPLPKLPVPDPRPNSCPIRAIPDP